MLLVSSCFPGHQTKSFLDKNVAKAGWEKTSLDFNCSKPLFRAAAYLGCSSNLVVEMHGVVLYEYCTCAS